MDNEDYYFPEQKETRLAALEGNAKTANTFPEILPYSSSKSREEAERAMLHDMDAHPAFILSGVNANWNDGILSRIGFVFVLDAPLDTRLRRIEAREVRRFGARVQAGGDMHAQQKAFREAIAKRSIQTVLESAGKLPCEAVLLDGTRPIHENISAIIKTIFQTATEHP